jgi:hypothetical protein
MMAVWSSRREALEEALIDFGFCAAQEFGIFVTYERRRDSLKVHVAPDGMFAAFDSGDEILGEGEGAEDLRSVLMQAVSVDVGPTSRRRSFLERRTRRKSPAGVSNRARSGGDGGEGVPAALSASAFSDRNR